jgi:putative ABC transport system permease protein
MRFLESWHEFVESVSKNKLRTFLTGFSVAWGIFMFIILLGSGNALMNGVTGEFDDDATNSIWMWSDETTMEYKGFQPGRRIRWTNEDFNLIRKKFPELPNGTARYNFWRSEMTYENESSSYRTRAVHPDHQIIEKTIVDNGRYINQKDMDEYRKVIIIGRNIAQELFDKTDPVGKYLNLMGVYFKVVGVFHDDGNENENSNAFIPITTAQRVFVGRDDIHAMIFSTGKIPLEKTARIRDEIEDFVKKRHNVHPDDVRAIYCEDNNQEFAQVTNMINGIKNFVFILSILSIVIGVVGVSSIMTVVVKERTREIGIRKAIGATPFAVVSSIMFESVLITAFAGYLGMLLGIGLLEIINSAFPDGMHEMFVNPEVDIQTVMNATIVLVVCGSLAGFIPAYRAASIKPIEALREE